MIVIFFDNSLDDVMPDFDFSMGVASYDENEHMGYSTIVDIADGEVVIRQRGNLEEPFPSLPEFLTHWKGLGWSIRDKNYSNLPLRNCPECGAKSVYPNDYLCEHCRSELYR